MPTTFSRDELALLYERPLLELVFAAAEVHRAHHDPQSVQCATLLNIKTGACPEDCRYCSQSAHYDTSLERAPLMDEEAVVQAATLARDGGADRFCMGAAWRGVKDNEDFARVCSMVSRVKALGLETCATLGMLDDGQAEKLAAAGLDYYNHNLDTSEEFYPEVVTTRTYQERLDTIACVQRAGMKVCCGGILGMGESRSDRVALLHQLASLDPQPESVPINCLVAVSGTPLGAREPLPWDELVRAVATARIAMPRAYVRLSAGRRGLNDATQAMCFLAGANSIFLGDKLLTTANCDPDADAHLFARLGLKAQGAPCGAES